MRKSGLRRVGHQPGIDPASFVKTLQETVNLRQTAYKHGISVQWAAVLLRRLGLRVDYKHRRIVQVPPEPYYPLSATKE